MSQLAAKEKEVTLLDLLDRILNKGVILYGDVTLSVADVDLVYLSLKVLLTSVETAEKLKRAASLRLEPGAGGAAASSDPKTEISS
jgi:gas vesicle structural protein